MSVISLILFVFTVGMASLIINSTIKRLKKANLKEKKSHLKLVDEQYQEMLDIKKEHKNINQKQKELNKFTQE